jgi:hypothetical protein
MASKPPYLYIKAAVASTEPTEPRQGDIFTQVAVIGKNMYVPVFAAPGDYFFRNMASTERVKIVAGEVVCFDVGNKFRGISLPVVERIENLEICAKMLAERAEGVQLIESSKRMYPDKNSDVPEATANTQATLVPKKQYVKVVVPGLRPSDIFNAAGRHIESE